MNQAMNTATNNKIPRSNPYEKPISYADREDPIDPIDEPVQTHVDRTTEKLKPMFLTVKLTTFTTICILSFDSSINSFNLNSEQKKKPKQKKKKKKKKPKIKPNQRKYQNQTEGEVATKWVIADCRLWVVADEMGKGLVGSPSMACRQRRREP
jgi:hypothetical protein